jgi:hypothetical protein
LSSQVRQSADAGAAAFSCLDLGREFPFADQPSHRQRVGYRAAASVVAFRLGPAGGWINGRVLRANGGMV